ncbi:hypothetical protein MNAN1_002640 [Malassezia nana]|uniref:Ribosome biogenesis protein NSA1 n=1 Tax=Malassezia nana TaxID=180528 RepID=A0AAF0J365_9BASI|nr:hypothetical protein MNAN1_002640 [Malassezia nana]
MASLPELRVFAGDAAGRIQVLYTQSKKYDTMDVPGCKYGPGMACQLLASGMLSIDPPLFVIALARKNGTIDILRASEDAPTGELLGTVREERMRFFRYVPMVELLQKKPTVAPTEWQTSAIAWTVPGPLHHVAFYPPASDTPSHFAYGGEQVPLSVWSLAKALEAAQWPMEPSASDEPSTVRSGGKRPAATTKSSKSRDLLPGELWRAKNLPNDHLSLPRPPLIRTLAFAPVPEGATENELRGMRVYVGTKDGIVRVYEPAQKPRPLHEWQIGAKPQGSLRVLHVCASEQALLVGDTSRHLSMVDMNSGRILFQYKDMTGTISDIQTVWDAQAKRKLVLCSSLDHLMRLCDMGEPYGQGQRRRGQVLEHYFTGMDHVVALALDPRQAPASSEPASDDEENVWDTMAVVGEKGALNESHEDKEGKDEDEDDSDAPRADARRAEKRHRRDP